MFLIGEAVFFEKMFLVLRGQAAPGIRHDNFHFLLAGSGKRLYLDFAGRAAQIQLCFAYQQAAAGQIAEIPVYAGIGVLIA